MSTLGLVWVVGRGGLIGGAVGRALASHEQFAWPIEWTADDLDTQLDEATAEFRLSEAGEADLSTEYAMLAEAAERFRLAREEAEGFGEDQQAQIRLLEVYHAWAKALHAEGTGTWYERNDEETLKRARAIVDQGLALPNITGAQRVRMEELGTRIDRALTPWPIL